MIPMVSKEDNKEDTGEETKTISVVRLQAARVEAMEEAVSIL